MRVACILFHSQNEAIEKFAETCLRFSPQIAIRANDAVFIEIGKSRTLFSEHTFTLRCQALLAKFGLSASIAVASSPHDALVSARFKASNHSMIPLNAFIDYISPFKSDQELSKRLDKMITSLQSVGVKTIFEFLTVPKSDLPSRFGPIGLLIHDRIIDSTSVIFPRWFPTEPVKETIELSYGEYFGTIEPLLFICKQALDRIFSRLKGRVLRLSSLSVVLYQEKFSSLKNPRREFHFELMVPQGSTLAVIPILRERFERDFQRKPIESQILRVDFEVIDTTPGYEEQSNYLNQENEQREELNSIVAHLAETVGKENIFKASLLEERFPESSFKRVSADSPITTIDLNGVIPQRPSRLLKNPHPIQVTQNSVFIRKKPYKILNWSSVERISGRWLDKEESRSYYRLSIEDAPAIWVFEDINKNFFMHGYFE